MKDGCSASVSDESDFGIIGLVDGSVDLDGLPSSDVGPGPVVFGGNLLDQDPVIDSDVDTLVIWDVSVHLFVDSDVSDEGDSETGRLKHFIGHFMGEVLESMNFDSIMEPETMGDDEIEVEVYRENISEPFPETETRKIFFGQVSDDDSVVESEIGESDHVSQIKSPHLTN